MHGLNRFFRVLTFALICRGSLPPALHEEAFTCLAHSVGQVGGGLPCSVDPRVWLLDEVVMNLKQRKSVVQVRTTQRWDIGIELDAVSLYLMSSFR